MPKVTDKSQTQNSVEFQARQVVRAALSGFPGGKGVDPFRKGTKRWF